MNIDDIHFENPVLESWAQKLLQARHRRRGFVFFFQNGQPCDVARLLRQILYMFGFRIEGGDLKMATPIQGPPNAVTQIFANDPRGVTVVFIEADDTGKVLPAKGPLGFQVSDPAGTVNVIAGSADGTVPEQLVPNGSGKTGTVTVTVTDSGNNIMATGTLTIAAPAPPPGPTQGAVFFTPNTTPPAAPAASTPKVVDPHNP